MLKTQVTKKAIMQCYGKVIAIGYCNAQHLLQYTAPNFYTYSREYGWRADVYIIDGVAIVTGYAPFGNIRPAYDTVREYDEKAARVYDTVRHYEDRRDITNGYLHEFIKEVTQ